MSSADPRVGFVGLGSQGAPIAEMITRAGHRTTVWARRSAQTATLRELGCDVADDLTGLGKACDIVGVCVTADDDLREVGATLLASLHPGTTIVVHSTVHPDTVRQLADAAVPRRIDVLDAPVMGGGAAAFEARLTVVVGGDVQVLERCRPVLRSFADPLVHVGVVGDGQRLKLIYNLLFVANAYVQDRAADAAVALGLDRAGVAVVIDRLRDSTFARRLLARQMTPDALAHSHRILSKDVALAVDVLAKAHVDGSPLDTLGRAGLDVLDALSHPQQR